MDIEYEIATYRNKATVTDSVERWLIQNLNQGGIELQLSKMRFLLSLIGEQWLAENKDQLDKVVDAVGCDGFNHRLVNKEQ